MDVSSAPPTAGTAFRLRMLPLDDTRTLKYNTLAYARILQKYNTYPRAWMALAAHPWQTCRDAAVFPHYFGQYYCRRFVCACVSAVRGDGDKSYKYRLFTDALRRSLYNQPATRCTR